MEQESLAHPVCPDPDFPDSGSLDPDFPDQDSLDQDSLALDSQGPASLPESAQSRFYQGGISLLQGTCRNPHS